MTPTIQALRNELVEALRRLGHELDQAGAPLACSR